MRFCSIHLLATAALAAAACFAQGIITTVGGTLYSNCSLANGVQAPTACMSPGGIALDKQGNLYYADGRYALIRKITPGGIVSTIGGTTQGYSGDGGPATSAKFVLSGGSPGLTGIALDASGDIYVSDRGNNVVRVINASNGIVTTVAGTGSPGYNGDAILATRSSLSSPAGIALDSAGNLYIADILNNRVRKVNTSGVISTFAGDGNASYEGDNVLAVNTAVVSPNGVTVDSAGNVYIAESDRIRKVDTLGIITTIAGKTSAVQTPGFTGDGGQAVSALLSGPLGMVVDAAGNLFFADANNQRIRKINTGGIISTYAGVPGNVSTPLGDGGPATLAYLGMVRDVALDAAGNLYVAASPGAYDDLRKIAPSVGLVITPTSLSFSSTFGGAAPASQTVNVTSTGAPLSFTAAVTSGSWLSVTTSGGTTPATLTISVNPAGLAASTTYPGSITLTPSGAGASALPFSVIFAVTGAGAPSISSGGIVNATGYQTLLAPDTVFTIFGNSMGPATLTAASAPNYPTSLGGTSITFTPSGGGTPINAKLVYSSAGQVAGLLPSSITPGKYSVQLTYNGQASAPQTVTMVARSFGIATANSAGTGAAQATIGNVNGGVSLVRLTNGTLAFNGLNWTLAPAHPNDTLVLWGTGGGADSLNDNGGSSGDQTVAGNFTVTVDGTVITPQYAGASSGYPGLWQINFTLPATIAADCFATLQVTAGGNLSNLVTIAIAPPGQSSCSSQISTSTLSTLSSGGNIVMAGLTMNHLSFTGGVQENVGGVFNRYTAAEFLIPYSGPKFGLCTVLDETYPAGGKEPSYPDALLDAGTLTISGPGLTPARTVGVTTTAVGTNYESSLTVGTLVDGGTYTLSGAGGKDVGPFTVTATMPTSFNVTNLSSLATINRSQPLTINWTGSGFDQVIILIQSGNSTSTTAHGVVVSCAVPASPGAYTIPTAALAYLLPAGGAGTIGQVVIDAGPNAGGVASAESATSTEVTPNLVAGGKVDFGSFTPTITYITSATIQ
jgi:trimeric autotransporter adhesin